MRFLGIAPVLRKRGKALSCNRWFWRLQNRELTSGVVAAANFRMDLPTFKKLVDSFADVTVHRDCLPVQDLDADFKSWLIRSFQHCFLRATSARFIVSQSDGLNATNEIYEGGILEQIFQGIAVCGANQHNASFGNRSCCGRFLLSSDFVDHDYFRSVIFDGFNHHGMLGIRV